MKLLTSSARLAIHPREQERIVMPAIKPFIRSLAQAFGISSPQQARQMACTWTPPSKTRSETDPDQPTAAAAATKKG
jgi:hypothetical protein